LKCPKCGNETPPPACHLVTDMSYAPQLIDGRWHTHDNNCITRHYYCRNCEERWVESILRTCSVPGCTWTGNKTCFCHKGEKVTEWTDR